MYRVDDPTRSATLPAPAAAGSAGYYTDGDPTSGAPATIVRADHLNAMQEEIAGVIEAAGIVLDKTKRDQLLKAIKAIGSYDVPWFAGVAGADLTVSTYGRRVLTRPITFLGETCRCEVAPVGAALIFDVLLNGSSIYTTKPQIASGANTGTAGILGVTAGAVGQLLEFLVTQIGSTTAGQQASFTLKGQVG